MRDLETIIQENSNKGIVMRLAARIGDYDTIDLLSCGLGYDVSDEELEYYLEHETFEGLIF